MSGYYPPGMSASQIPGFDDEEVTIGYADDECGYDGDADAVRGRHTTRGRCPGCHREFEFENDSLY